MVSENDNDNQRNSGRLQSPSLNVEQIKKQIEKGMKDGIEEEMGSEGAFKDIAKSKSIKDLKGEILKKAEEKGSGQKSSLYNDLKELQRQNRLHPQESRENQVRKIREQSRRESEQVTEEASKQIKDRKARMAMKIAGKQMDAVAYAISQKMAAEAKKGGVHAVVPITMTYLLALSKDVLDALLNVLDITVVGAVVVTAVGILSSIFVGIVIALFWVQVSGGWKGGIIRRKLIKKILVKYGIAILIDSAAVINIIPTFFIINIWTHYDFHKSNKKAGSDHNKFKTEYQATRKINEKYAGYF